MKLSTNFDARLEFKVKKQAMLGQMTIKSLRALRKELYRPYPDFWTGRSTWGANATIGHSYVDALNKATDIYDRWRHPEFWNRGQP
jgi:hypothetical protein